MQTLRFVPWALVGALGACSFDETLEPMVDAGADGDEGDVAYALSPGDIVLHAGDGSATIVGSRWVVENSSSGASGKKIRNYNQNGTNSATVAPSAAPSDYFELTFSPRTGKDYRVWVRGLSQDNHYANDSVSIQFSNSVDAAGQPVFRSGTTSAMLYSVQDCSTATMSSWGWQEPDTYSACGSQGRTIRFASTTARVRVQIRQDGITIDQIVIASASSPRPGAVTNDATIHPRNTVDTSTSSGTALRVVNWNMHKANRAEATLDASVRKILAFQPDVVTLQEVYGVDPAAVLRLRDRMQTISGRTWHHIFLGSDKDENQSGVMVLSRFPFTRTSTRDLGCNSYGDTDGTSFRPAVNGQVSVGGRLIDIISVHLDYPQFGDPTCRTRNAQNLASWVSAFTTPVIAAGDYNAAPESGGAEATAIGHVRTVLADACRDHFSSDSACPKTRQGWRPDAIYREPTGMRSTLWQVSPADSLSDHQMVSSVIQLQ